MGFRIFFMIRKLVLIGILLFKVGQVLAGENIAAESAQLNKQPLAERISYKAIVVEESRKRKALASVLEKYNSPLAGEVDSFMKTCSSYKLDCYLLPAITGLESSFGVYIYPNSYNPFGWDRGYAMFANWNQAIATVGAGLRNRYINQGAVSVEQIGGMYSESPTWAVRVQRFMAMFESEEEQNQLNFSDFELKL